MATLTQLLDAFENEDSDAARQALNSPFIKHIDVAYAKLARDMKLPQGLQMDCQKSSPKTVSNPAQCGLKPHME